MPRAAPIRAKLKTINPISARSRTLSPLAAFSEKLCHYKGAWGREKRPLAERQGSPAAARRLGVCQRWHGRSGSSRTIGCVFLPGVADLQLGATRKRLAWLSAMETATPSDLPFAAADTASGERWISLREQAEAHGVSQHSAAQLVRRNGWRRQKDNRGHGPGRPGGPGGVGGPPWSAGWSRRRGGVGGVGRPGGVGGASRPAQRPAGEGQGCQFATSGRRVWRYEPRPPGWAIRTAWCAEPIVRSAAIARRRWARRRFI